MASLFSWLGESVARGCTSIWHPIRLAWNAKQTDDNYTSRDPRFADKTAEEKKVLIIERELNRQGMGKYQVCQLCSSAWGCQPDAHQHLPS